MTAYYTLGNTGLRVSRLALGTMTFGTDWGWGDKPAGYSTPVLIEATPTGVSR